MSLTGIEKTLKIHVTSLEKTQECEIGVMGQLNSFCVQLPQYGVTASIKDQSWIPIELDL